MDINALRQKEIEYCGEHIEYFVETYGHIECKDAPELIQPFKMWPMQKEALKSIETHRRSVIMKARQLGFSWLVLHYAAWLMITKTGRTIIGLSMGENEAKELVRRMSVILKNMPEFIRQDSDVPSGYKGNTFHVNAMDIMIHYLNGPDSLFKCFPSSQNATSSFTADLLILDEWAKQQFAREIWTAALPVVNRPTGGQVIGLSSIIRGSLFEEIFTNRDNNFNKIFIPWDADPSRDQKWYDETKKDIGDMITQEYPKTIEEALTVPGGSFFPEVKKETHETDDMPTKSRRYIALDYGLDMLSVHWFAMDINGHTVIYREYDSPNKTIGEACDIIISLTGDEKIDLILAPPDLWNRSQESGKSRAVLFFEGGLNLVKSSNDFKAGCAAMKEDLRVRPTGAKLKILKDKCPNLYNSLIRIQKDEKRPDVYAKEPHDLTHDCDSLRYYSVYWTTAADIETDKKKKKWTPDIYEDYENANENDRKMIVEKYGEPEW